MNNWLLESNWLVLLPEITLALAAIGLMLASVILPASEEGAVPEGLAIFGLILAAVAVPLAPIGPGYFGMVSVDPLTRSALLIGIAGTGLIFGLVPHQFPRSHLRYEIAILLLFSLTGLGLMVTAQNLVMLFLGLETLSLPLYILAGLHSRNSKSREAAIKYFLIGAFASAILLFGMAFFLAEAGDLSLLKVNKIFGTLEGGRTPSVFLCGFTLIAIGLFFKIGAIPFHMWVADVYQGSPAVFTAFMAFVPKLAGFVALIKLWPQPFEAGVTLLYFLAIFTMTGGNLLALVQRNVKRMLACSSIAHTGYLLMALLVLPAGAPALLFYLAVYAITNVAAFGALGFLSPERESDLTLADLKGVLHSQPLAALGLSCALFSLTGLPPFGGFMAKFGLIKTVYVGGHGGLAMVAILNSLLSAWYYLRLVLYINARPFPISGPKFSAAPNFPENLTLTLAMGLLLLSGVLPDLIATFLKIPL